jgi:RNA polymerase sigma-70 factor (ECF subfamily)
MLLFEKYQSPVFRFAYRMTGSTDTAKDLTQECFLSLLNASNRFDEKRAPLKSYLYGMVRNLVRRSFRNSGAEVPWEDYDEPATTETGYRYVLQQELSRAVEEAVGRLPLPQREALLLFEYEDLSLDEISRILQIDTGAVKSRLHRARENLRHTLTPYTEAKERSMA